MPQFLGKIHSVKVLTYYSYLFKVKFLSPVSIAENPKINEWLTLVEKEMRVSLARLLAQAVNQVKTFLEPGATIDSSSFMTWVRSRTFINGGFVPKPFTLKIVSCVDSSIISSSVCVLQM